MEELNLQRSHLALALDIASLDREIRALRERVETLDNHIGEFLAAARKHLIETPDHVRI